MVTIFGPDTFFAFQLRTAVNAQWVNPIRLDIRAGFASIVNVVSRNVYEPSSGSPRSPRENSRRFRINACCEFSLVLGFIDGRVGGCIDDNVGCYLCHRAQDAIRALQIQNRSADTHKLERIPARSPLG